MSEFLDMGGYGFYVWACYGVAAVTLLGLLAQSLIVSAKNRKDLAMLEQLKKKKG